MKTNKQYKCQECRIVLTVFDRPDRYYICKKCRLELKKLRELLDLKIGSRLYSVADYRNRIKPALMKECFR